MVRVDPYFRNTGISIYIFSCIFLRTLLISASKAAALKCVSHTDVFRKTGTVYIYPILASKATATQCALHIDVLNENG